MDVKKQAIIGMTFIAILGASGCGVTKLNEEQNAQAAEYIAGLMLKHTEGYEKSLIYPVVTTEPVELEETQIPSQTDWNEGKTPFKNNKSESKDDSKNVSSDLNDVLGIAGCKVEYKSMKVCNSFMEKKNASYGIFAESGKKLVAVRFEIKNKSSKNVKLNLHKKDITYQLLLPDGTAVISQPTLLDNDMNYLSASVKKGKKIEGVAIFMVSKKTNVKNAKLKIIGGNTTTEINL